MRFGNPNIANDPYKPVDWRKSGHMMGNRNPFGFGPQRVMGAIAPQRNLRGMPTNTLPLPPQRPPMRPGGVQVFPEYPGQRDIIPRRYGY